MPVFYWNGVTVHGKSVSGSIFARSEEHLSTLLMQKDIALLKSRISFFNKGLSRREREQFLAYLSSLLKAHINLYEALTIIASSYQGVKKEVIEDIASLVLEGRTFTSALEMHDINDPLTKALVLVGERGGDVSQALEALVFYQQQREQIYTNLSTALFSPLITVVFFVITLLGILIGIVPQFQTYYESYAFPLPFMTKVLIALSGFIRSWVSLCIGILIFFIVGMFLRMLKRTERLFFLKMPIIGALLLEFQRISFLKTISLLLHQNITLSQALFVYEATLYYPAQKQQLTALKNRIMGGNSFEQAFAHHYLYDQEIVAYIKIGESTGRLAQMLSYASEKMQQSLFIKIEYYIKILQPLIMLVLGLAVAFLIIALYVPIISFSSAIG